jgi:CubicO group peptidase (beta-lactamase class C family)
LRFSPFRILALLVLAFSSVTLASAQSDRSNGYKSPEKVDALFVQWSKPDSPGCALAVIKQGQVIYQRGYGLANLDFAIPISSKSVFNIASVSKQFTAMSIALLARQGKLSLDDDIRKYVPEFPQYQSPITIRNLIYQTSGIREYSHLMSAAGIRFQDASDEDVFKMLMQQKNLNFKPGEEYLYSNSNYFLLAQIVRSASGKSLREFAEANIFKPLGMVNTGFQNDGTEVIRNRATGYSSRNGGGFSVETPGSYHIGGGGLSTTIDDLLLWDQNYYNNKLGGGAQLIQEFLSQGTLNSGGKTDYAFGIDVETYKGLKMFGHDGVYNGFNAAMIRFPEQRFSVICLCNLTSIQSPMLVRQVADIYLADEFKQGEMSGSKIALPELEVVHVPEKELAAVAGSYFASANNNFRRLYVKNGKLIYSRGTSESELAPLGNSRFLMLGTPDRVEISFKSPRPGAPLQMITAVNGEVAMTHDSVEPATYTSSQLIEFAGTYYSSEIDATYSISLQGEKLVLRRKNVDGETPMLGQFADVFSTAGTGSIRFTRNRENQVTGFLLNTGRVRRLRFDKCGLRVPITRRPTKPCS